MTTCLDLFYIHPFRLGNMSKSLFPQTLYVVHYICLDTQIQLVLSPLDDDHNKSLVIISQNGTVFCIINHCARGLSKGFFVVNKRKGKNSYD